MRNPTTLHQQRRKLDLNREAAINPVLPINRIHRRITKPDYKSKKPCVTAKTGITKKTQRTTIICKNKLHAVHRPNYSGASGATL